jgi:hypothetical protein
VWLDKKVLVQFKLHVTIDDESDFEYVKTITAGLNVAYYFVNKETISLLAEKVKIFRTKFIFNYYFNVVKPFIYGWTFYLDDDDELVSSPEIGMNQSTIYLYRSGVRR